LRTPLREEGRQWLQLCRKLLVRTRLSSVQRKDTTRIATTIVSYESGKTQLSFTTTAAKNGLFPSNASLFLDVTFLVSLDEEHNSMMKANVKTAIKTVQGTVLTNAEMGKLTARNW
jgi:hypothetical protein